MSDKRRGVKAIITMLMIVNLCIVSYSAGVSTFTKTTDVQKRSSILYVGGSGPGNYSTIQQAIKNASEEDTVFVYNGIYVGPVVIDVAVQLIGEDNEQTEIRGSGDGVLVYADDVVVSNFKITECGDFWNYCGIYANSDGTQIQNNRIVDNDRSNSIYLDACSYCIVKENIIEHNDFHGIRMEFSSNNQIQRNYINECGGYGIYLWECSNNLVSENSIFDCDYVGIDLNDYCENNQIFRNNVFNCTNANAHDGWGASLWNLSVDIGGNFWSDHDGSDENQDGFIDVPYEITGGLSYDFLPLSSPFGLPDTIDFSGPSEGKIKTETVFEASISDPEDDEVYVFVDWGDGQVSGWIGPFASDEVFEISHTWSSKGEFEIRVKAKDCFGLETEFVSIPISMPRNHMLNSLFESFHSFWSFLFKNISYFDAQTFMH